MKKLLLPILLIMLISCGVQHQIPTVHNSFIIKDSTVIHTELVAHPLPQESHSIITQEKKSHLETSLAKSDASIDSLGMLHHSIENKQDSIKVRVEYRDRIVVRDSLVKVEVPVEKIVEKQVKYVPKIYTYSLIFSIVALVGIILMVLKK